MNLAQLFFDAARAHPSREALVLPEGSLSYSALEDAALAIRAALSGRDEPTVAILASKSLSAYAGVIGVLAAGSSYVPLNPAFPAQRNRNILQAVRAKTIIVGPEAAAALAELLPLLDAKGRVVTIEHAPAIEEVARARAEYVVATGLSLSRGVAPVSQHATAYVMFTSGSTGTPKGVSVSHHNVRSYVRSFLALYPIFGHDRLTQTFDLTFDLSVHDLFVCWSVGATLVPYSSSALASPIEFTRAHSVSVWFSVPSVVAHLESARKLDSAGLPGLRLSLFCGEKLSYNAWKVWRSVAPQSRIVNLYGPTEATIAITHFEVPADFEESATVQGVIPIGRPFAGQRAEPLRDDGTVAPVGEVGALWLSGDQLSAGYFEDAELTAQRFVVRAGVCSYRTGDRAGRDESGCLAFFGREDLQVKVMGYRVELGEIEHALRSVSGSVEAIALLLDRDGFEELVAALPLPAKPRKSAMRQALEGLLPSYMRPRRYCFLSEYPLNASGKIDRAALSRLLSNCESTF